MRFAYQDGCRLLIFRLIRVTSLEDSLESERMAALLPDKCEIRKSGLLDEVRRILSLKRYTPICTRNLSERICFEESLQLGLQYAALGKDCG
jgi:hypothetical protein